MNPAIRNGAVGLHGGYDTAKLPGGSVPVTAYVSAHMTTRVPADLQEPEGRGRNTAAAPGPGRLDGCHGGFAQPAGWNFARRLCAHARVSAAVRHGVLVDRVNVIVLL